jgi:hypothetical protein
VTTIEDSPCPSCGAAPGCLSVEFRLAAKSVGSFSLAGAQTKFAATEVPELSCSACGLFLTGVFDGDGRHVSFPYRDFTGTHAAEIDAARTAGE